MATHRRTGIRKWWRTLRCAIVVVVVVIFAFNLLNGVENLSLIEIYSSISICIKVYRGRSRTIVQYLIHPTKQSLQMGAIGTHSHNIFNQLSTAFRRAHIATKLRSIRIQVEKTCFELFDAALRSISYFERIEFSLYVRPDKNRYYFRI